MQLLEKSKFQKKPHFLLNAYYYDHLAPDLMVNNTRHPNTSNKKESSYFDSTSYPFIYSIVQHLPNQNILDTGDFEDEDEEEDYSTSNLHLPAPRYHPHLPPPFPQQPYNHSPSLPSISSLIHGIQESNMPPPMKRLKKH
jgi:hypothetical protein